MADPGEHAGIGDLVAVQMQDREDNAVGHRIQELVGMPARGEWPSLCLAIAYDTGNDQVGIVERGAVRVRDCVPEFAALVYRARRLRCHVARNTTREGELREEALHAFFIL